VTRASETRRAAKAARQQQLRDARKLELVRRTKGEQAATDIQLQRHAAQWAKRVWGADAHAKHMHCACGAEFISLVIMGTAMETQCSTCREGNDASV
jgi:hypothetical protein